MADDHTKVSGLRSTGGFHAYRRLMYGEVSLGYVLWAELVFGLLGGLPGAAGLWLRGKCYPPLFGAAGRGLVIGRHVTFRHPGKIRFGNDVVIDDHAVMDAKGDGNRGIDVGDRVFIGRGTIVYCKD